MMGSNERRVTRTWAGRLVVAVLAGLACSAVRAEEIRVFDLPDGAKSADASTWRALDAEAKPTGGAAIQNARIVVVAQAGLPGVVVRSVAADLNVAVDLCLVGKDGKADARITKVELLSKERSQTVLRVTAGTMQAEVKLRPGQPFVEVSGAGETKSVEVRQRMRYVVLPDFFGHDIVFDPRRYKSDTLAVAAENFVLGMLDGGNGMVMCVWKGGLGAGAEAADAKEKAAAGGSRDPQVDIALSGQDADRVIERSRIEFAGGPIFVGLLVGKAIWFDMDIRAVPGQKPTALDWTRPFEAKWRADYISKPGASSADLLSRVVTWDVSYRSETPDGTSPDGIYTRGGRPVPTNWDLRPEKDGVPLAIFQGLWPWFMNMAWINDTSDPGRGKMFLAVYSDMSDRKAAESANKQSRTDKVYPPHPFDRVLIYPLDRRAQTPTTAFTPTDLMRESLGQGPCGYVLDLEGIKAMPMGGSRATLATCGTWDAYIKPLVDVTQGRAAGITANGATRKIAGLRPGQRLAAQDQAFLVGRLEDLVLFVTAVNQRLQQYRKFYTELQTCCQEQVQANANLRPLADEVLRAAALLDRNLSQSKLDGFKRARDEWQGRITKVIGDVKSGNYASLAGVGAIRDDLAAPQDVTLSFCRRAVKNVRQVAASADTADPEVARFAARVGDICHGVSRNRHGFEGH